MSEVVGPRKTRIFMSYSRRDTPFVEDLHISLETYGFEVTYDQDDIASGEPWEPRLRALINEADTTVCVVSEHWIASTECVKELAIALERGRRVIPVITQPIDPARIPPEVARLQFVFFHGEKYTYARGVAELIEALRLDIDWVREQSRLLALASDWDAAGRSDAMRLRGEALQAALAWQGEDMPRDVKVLPVVADFIAASEKGALDDKQKKLRGRIWQVALGSLAIIGVLGAGLAFAWGEMRITQINAERELEQADNAAFIASLDAQNCTTQPIPADTGKNVPEQPQTAGPDSCRWANDGECDEPDLCAPGTDSADCAGSSLPEPVVTPPERAVLSETDASQLVARLNSTDRTTRLQAGQAVATALRETSDPEILRALVYQLESPQVEQLSGSGRFNMLYMLNLSEGWEQAGIRGDMRTALSEMQTNQSIYIGDQTRDCITNLEHRLDGQEDVPRTCGGR